LALRNQNIDLPQLRNDLFRLVSLPCHCSPPGCQRHTSSRTTSMGVDHIPRCVGRSRLSACVQVLSPPFSPILLFFALYGRCVWVLHLEPIRGEARAVRRVLSFREDAF